MSVKAMTWVWSLSLPASQKLVMLALADHANDEGKCWPGLETVADKCGMTARNLITILQKLEKGGYLTHAKRYDDNGHRKSNIYRLEMDDFLPSTSKSLKEASASLNEKISHRLCEENAGLSEKISGILEPTNKPSIKPSRPKTKFSDDDMRCAEWLYQHLKEFKPDCRPANLNSWANHVRLMRERDKRTHRQICELFRWTLKDTFWQDNVQCPEALRKKWDTLSSKQKKQQTQGRTAVSEFSEPML